MKKMKLKAFVLALLLILLGTASVGTLAYFTADETVHNVITSGGVDITLYETIDENGTPWPEEGVDGVMPGEDVPKIVFIKNTGASDAWVRIRLTTVVTLSDGKTRQDFLPDGTPAVVYNLTNTSMWFDGKDGYYYYRKPLEPGASTEPIIDFVNFSPAMANEYQNCTAEVEVKAYAVQVANNPIPADGDITDVKGWPAD